MKIGDSRDSYRTESHELILPFFEKEPDWDKFHIFQFPDGREVYEINLANAELYFPSYLSDSIPGTEPNKAVIQNIMFVENKENGRFDPVIARYYPNNENSIREFGEIYYNMIDLGWSGTVDIWTYDERHFIGFKIQEGQIISNYRKNLDQNENARKTYPQGINYLTTHCQDYAITYLAYTVTAGGQTTEHYETQVVTECRTISGGGAAPGTGSGGTGIPIGGSETYEYGGSGGYEYGGSGSNGTVNEAYVPPIISAPDLIVYNNLTDPCARKIFIDSSSPNNPPSLDLLFGLNINPLIVKLFNDCKKIPYTIQQSNLTGSNAITEFKSGGIEITLNSSYLQKASQLSIARTIIHENIHAYFIHQTKTNLDFALGLNKFANDNDLGNLADTHHELMGQYVLSMAVSLYQWEKKFGPNKGNLDFDYYYAMSFAGLLDNKTKLPNSSFKSLAGDNLDKYMQIIINEATNSVDAKSKPC
ncbi:hypothetical protein [Aquiflexum lacus]|uniref:hypothetical protein n=1 Tax=Aquiflexum lacus TaxID=2483805 RepID=UPI0018933242|nr:hypothetical protein [Aquiflexum lacus]